MACYLTLMKTAIHDSFFIQQKSKRHCEPSRNISSSLWCYPLISRIKMKLIKTYRKKNWWYQRSDLISLVCFAESLHAFDFLEALVIKATSWRIIYTCKLVHTHANNEGRFLTLEISKRASLPSLSSSLCYPLLLSRTSFSFLMFCSCLNDPE